MKKRLIALAFTAALASTAGADTIYKCGASYSNTPCEGATTLQPVPMRSDANAAKAADDMTKRQAKLGDAMEKARLKEEAKPVAVYIPPPKPVSTEDNKKIEMTKPGKVQYFTAVAPGKASKASKASGVKHKKEKKKAR